jgi:hypothetical protein
MDPSRKSTIKKIINKEITDQDLIRDNYKFLIKENKSMSDEIQKLYFNTPGSLSIKDIEKEYALKKEQNETTRNSYVQKYIYLILKVILSIALFFIVFFRSRKYISLQSTANTISSSLIQLKQQTSNTMKKATNKYRV